MDREALIWVLIWNKSIYWFWVCHQPCLWSNSVKDLFSYTCSSIIFIDTQCQWSTACITNLKKKTQKTDVHISALQKDAECLLIIYQPCICNHRHRVKKEFHDRHTIYWTEWIFKSQLSEEGGIECLVSVCNILLKWTILCTYRRKKKIAWTGNTNSRHVSDCFALPFLKCQVFKSVLFTSN